MCIFLCVCISLHLCMYMYTCTAVSLENQICRPLPLTPLTYLPLRLCNIPSLQKLRTRMPQKKQKLCGKGACHMPGNSVTVLCCGMAAQACYKLYVQPYEPLSKLLVSPLTISPIRVPYIIPNIIPNYSSCRVRARLGLIGLARRNLPMCYLLLGSSQSYWCYQHATGTSPLALNSQLESLVALNP